MKTFEEKWTAWLDGQLTGKELADFEASLPDKTAAEAEKQDPKKLGALLKEQLTTQTMGNLEFFHHQLQQRIQADERSTDPSSESRPKARLWPIGRLVWAGAASLAIFCLCTFFVVREQKPADQSQYLTQILNWRVDPAVSPDATISMFNSKEDKVTVLWVDGLQSFPSEYATK